MVAHATDGSGKRSSTASVHALDVLMIGEGPTTISQFYWLVPVGLAELSLQT
jgi:hypothetical protein